MPGVTATRSKNRSCYSKADIEKIVKHLLAQDPEINEWHSPKGVRKKDNAIFVRLTDDEEVAFKWLMKKRGCTTMAGLVKLWAIEAFIKVDNKLVVKLTKEIGKNEMTRIFGVAAREVHLKETGKRSYKKKSNDDERQKSIGA
jgi:hypothetical protein